MYINLLLMAFVLYSPRAVKGLRPLIKLTPFRLYLSTPSAPLSSASPSVRSNVTSSSSLPSHHPTPSEPIKLNIYNVPDEELATLLKAWKQPSFRVKQIREWIYDKGCLDFQSMENLPTDLRGKLADSFTFGALLLASEQVSKDGTLKRAYQLHDKQLIESVLMPYEDGRRTACISSQAGCAMGCVFCATGQMGFSRQLTSTEIFEQAQTFSAE